VADGHVVAHRRARWRSIRAKRSGFADAGHSDRGRMAGAAVRDEHSSGVAGIYDGGDAEGGGRQDGAGTGEVGSIEERFLSARADAFAGANAKDKGVGSLRSE
jgi:hypothetical protein